MAKDHYDEMEPHVTMLTKDLICKYKFGDMPNRTHPGEINHWGKNDLRFWVNSTGNHSNEGFYREFSESFKDLVLTTIIPNKEWKSGTGAVYYSTEDRVFLPSTTELGDSIHAYTYQIGSAYELFYVDDKMKRVALIGEEPWRYWTRSPGSFHSGGGIRGIRGDGGFYSSRTYDEEGYYVPSHLKTSGVRPALNLKAGTLVSEIIN